MGYMSGGNCSLNNHTLFQQYFDSNNVDVGSGCGFINSYTLSQYEYPSTFNKIDDDVERGDAKVSSRYGF